jgi:muconolactone delta-isomerase
VVLPVPDQAEFLSALTVTIAPGTPPEVVADVYSREGARSRELADQGRLLRLWRLPGEQRDLGHRQARDPEQLNTILTALPLAPWWTVKTIPLTRHPNNPAVASTAPQRPADARVSAASAPGTSGMWILMTWSMRSPAVHRASASNCTATRSRITT